MTNHLQWAMSAEAAAIYERVLTNAQHAVDPTDPIVQELVATRFVHHAWGDMTRLIALPPEIAITRALATRTRQWMKAAPDLGRAQRAIDHFSRIVPSVIVPTSLEVNLDTSEARQQAGALLDSSARRQICLMQPYPSWMPDEVRDDPNAAIVAASEALSQGVTYRYLYDDRILADQQFRKLALEEIDLGVHARVSPTLPTWMMIVDETSAAYLPDPNSNKGVLTSAAGLVSLLQLAFESSWNTARPLDATRTVDNLTHKQREVLLLAIAGNTNEAIARELSINIKTVRRRVNELCEHFGASDRSALLTTASVTLK